MSAVTGPAGQTTYHVNCGNCSRTWRQKTPAVSLKRKDAVFVEPQLVAEIEYDRRRQAAARLVQRDQGAGAGRWCEDIRAATVLRVVSIQPAWNKAESSFPVFK